MLSTRFSCLKIDHLIKRIGIILTELIIGSLCAAFAKIGYDATMLLIFIPNLVIALVCFGFIGLSIFHFIREKRSKPSE
ncbi:hypothetical protein CWC26_05665 [Pseudoalteromonas sp. S4488]|nr:hypothetical protein CWC27_15615 [Pseudoalteromonas sp. S4491]TMO40310.1 hypothetical protein CWC26_05665 [Pseudoalteromonas sp. S4488]